MTTSSNTSNLVEQAKQFAINAHESIHQKRKYTNEPYQVHCERVVAILSEINASEEMLAAAWMHDVLEDVAPYKPEYSEEKIRELFGDRICKMVLELTDSKLETGNRATRKANDRLRLAKASPESKTIKLADLIDNLIDLQKNDNHFTIVFVRETELLLPCLSEGNAILFSRVKNILNNVLNNRH